MAGVTITTLTGENGILTKTQKAKMDTEEKTAEEKVKIEVMGSYDDNGMIDINTLVNNLKKIGTVEGEEFPLMVTVDGRDFEVAQNGTVTEGLSWENLKEDLKNNPDKYLQEAKEKGQNIDSLKDIGIGTDKKVVNLDLWNYCRSWSGDEFSLGWHAGSTGEWGYDPENIVDGKIQGKIPQCIYIAKDKEVYTITAMDGTFCYKEYIWSDEPSKGSLVEVPQIPSTVKYLRGTFWGNDKLTNIKIPNGVISLEYETFAYCSSLESIEIPESIQSIQLGYNIYLTNEIFKECNSLKKIEVDEKNKNYSSVNGILFNKEQTELIRYPVKGDIEEYQIPNTVTKICNGAFWNAQNLNSVNIPNSVTNIESYAFFGCTNLVNINIPNSVTNIESYAFSGWKANQTINFQKDNLYAPGGFSSSWNKNSYDNSVILAQINWNVSM